MQRVMTVFVFVFCFYVFCTFNIYTCENLSGAILSFELMENVLSGAGLNITS
jgi:hypothetical protein